MKDGVSLAELAKVFFKLGTIGFGGPAAHIVMMEEEAVKSRKEMVDKFQLLQF